MTTELAVRACLDALTGAVRPDDDGPARWETASPYVLRHILEYARELGEVDALVTDAGLLTHADPSAVLAALAAVSTRAARSAAAVYRTSAHQHTALPPQERRRLLQLDAVRLGDLALAGALADGSGPRWRTRWASGSSTSPDQLRVLRAATFTAWTALCVLDLAGRPTAVVSGDDGQLRRFDLATGRQAGPLIPTGAAQDVLAGAVGPDGRPRILAARGGVTQSFDALTGMAVAAPMHFAAGGFTSVLGPLWLHGRLPVVLGGTQRLEVRHLLTGELLAATEPVARWVYSLLVLDGAVPVAVTGGGDGAVRTWDVVTMRETGEPLVSHEQPVTALASLVVDGRTLLVSGSDDGTVRTWDLGRRELVSVTPRLGLRVPALTVASRAGRPVVLAGHVEPREIDVLTGTPLPARLPGHEGNLVGSAVVAVDGAPAVVTASRDGTVRLWRVPEPGSAPPAAGEVPGPGVVFSVDGRVEVLSADREGLVRWHVADPGGARRIWRAHESRVLCVAGGYAFAQSQAALWRVDLTTGEVQRLGSLAGTHAVVSVRHGRPVVLADDVRRGIAMWDAATGEPVEHGLQPFSQSFQAVHSGHTGLVSALAVWSAADGYRLAAVERGGPLRRWRLDTGTAVDPPLPVPVTGGLQQLLPFRWDERQYALLAASDQRAVHVIDLDTWTVEEPTVVPGPVTACDVGRLGDRPVAAVATADGAVHLVDLRLRRVLDRMILPGPARALTILPGGLAAAFAADTAVLDHPELSPDDR
ncbi:hypothetical protein ABZS66_25590 [Dactylosporangium sp. NPDC005572]|uniref:WD40 repeat domain-containing protein n=1 Tax=Dactylosporangium sp. NPDC005572 TaxID=3156889 RepID=UPI0033AA9AC6